MCPLVQMFYKDVKNSGVIHPFLPCAVPEVMFCRTIVVENRLWLLEIVSFVQLSGSSKIPIAHDQDHTHSGRDARQDVVIEILQVFHHDKDGPW